MKRVSLAIAAVCLGAASMLVLGAKIPEAHAQARVQCDVLIIHASSVKSVQLGAGLQQFPQLQQPPFNAYGTMRLLRRSRLPLALNTPGNVDLPNGRLLQVTYLGNDVHGHLRIQVSIAGGAAAAVAPPSPAPRAPGAPSPAGGGAGGAGSSTYLPPVEFGATPGAPFFQGGQTYQNGVLILGFVCGP